MSEDPYAVEDFEAFWPHYAAMHARPETQAMHAVATLACGGLVLAGLVMRRPVLVVLAPLVDYAIAQSSHRIFEKNRTMPWKNHAWHARAELRMLLRFLKAQGRSVASRREAQEKKLQGQPVGRQARSTCP